MFSSKPATVTKRSEIDLAEVPSRDLGFVLGSLLHCFPENSSEILDKLQRIFLAELKVRVERRRSTSHQLDFSTITAAELNLGVVLLVCLDEAIVEHHPAVHPVMRKIIEALRRAA